MVVFFLCCSDEVLHVVTPSSIDPTLLRRYNELFDAVTRARRDKKKKYALPSSSFFILFCFLSFCVYSCNVYVAYHLLFFCCVLSYFFSRRDLVAFKDEFGDITVGHVGESFWAYGTPSTCLAYIGVSMLADRFKGSQTMIVPYNLCVSVLANHTTHPHLICLIVLYPIFHLSH